MSLEQEKPINDFEQPSSTGVESFKISQNSIEEAGLSQGEMATIEELSIEPVAELPKIMPVSPATKAEQAGEQTIALASLAEKNIGDEAHIANRVVERLTEYKETT